MMRTTVVALAAVLLCGSSASRDETRTFVIRTEIDSVAVERVTRARDTLTGDLRLLEEKSYVHYALHLRADGSTERAEVFDESPGFFTGTIVFGAPEVNLDRTPAAGRVITVPQDYLPIIGTSIGLIDYVLRLHTPNVGDVVELKVINIRNRNPGRLTIKRLGRDSVLVDCAACMRPRVTEELRVGLSPDGGIEGAVRTEQHWLISVSHP